MGKVVLMVIVHAIAGLVLAPSGLVVPLVPYALLWVAWALAGAFGYRMRGSENPVKTLLILDALIVIAAYAVLPIVTDENEPSSEERLEEVMPFGAWELGSNGFA